MSGAAPVPVLARVERARIASHWVTDAVVELSASGMRLVEGGGAERGGAQGATPEPRSRERNVGLAPEPSARVRATIGGVLLPPITDAHVHLGLTDAARREPCALGRVLDLGWDPTALPGVAAAARAAHRGLDVRVAGPFHTAVGGYPSRRAWAPAGSVVELADPEAAARAVRALTAPDAGGAPDALTASAVKVVLNSDDGPTLDDAALGTLVEAARAVSLPVVAHVQGAGQAERAIDAGVAVLAHAPWTEHLPDELIARAAAAQTWISTLAMHSRDRDELAFARAIDNLARFAAAGGAVAYGTDLGNGTSRLDLDQSELAALRQAGIEGTALVDALLAEHLLPAGPTIGVLGAAVEHADGRIDGEVVDDETLLSQLHRVRALPWTWFAQEDA